LHFISFEEKKQKEAARQLSGSYA